MPRPHDKECVSVPGGQDQIAVAKVPPLRLGGRERMMTEAG